MWELVESPTGTITDKEIITLYQLLSYAVHESHQSLLKKIETQYTLAKHDKANGVKTWENEGGTCKST